MSLRLHKQLCPFFFAACLLIPFAGLAATEEADMDNGEEINEVCAGCHGEYAQGGGDGKYPRLAGLPKAFIEEQMHLFRSRIRPNMPMVEHVDERQMPDQDISDISAFIAAIKLKTKLAPADETAPDFNAY